MSLPTEPSFNFRESFPHVSLFSFRILSRDSLYLYIHPSLHYSDNIPKISLRGFGKHQISKTILRSHISNRSLNYSVVYSNETQMTHCTKETLVVILEFYCRVDLSILSGYPGPYGIEVSTSVTSWNQRCDYLVVPLIVFDHYYCY